MRVLKVLLVIVGVVMVLLLLALFAFDRLLRSTYEPGLANVRAEAAATADLFCDVQTKLSADPFFHQQRTEGDAAPLLNKWLAWEADIPKDSPLALPELPSDFGAKWLTEPPDTAALDFSWMAKLHSYDRWDLLAESPMAAQKTIFWRETPFPNFVPLQNWARLRLVHGIKSGDPASASKDVRQLAWLSYRTDTVLGGGVAAALLQVDREAWASVKEPPPEWQPMTTEQINRFRAVVRTGHIYSSVVSPAAVGQKSRSCGSPPVARCMALAESGAIARWLRPLMERNLKDTYAALDAEMKNDGCATSMPRRLWFDGAQFGDRNFDQADVTPEVVNYLPQSLAPGHIAGLLLRVVMPSTNLAEKLGAADAGTP